jgi:hypothetical protein
MSRRQSTAIGIRDASLARLRGESSWKTAKLVNDDGSWRQKLVKPVPPHVEATGQAVEVPVPRHHVYRLLRSADRDGWLGEAIA